MKDSLENKSEDVSVALGIVMIPAAAIEESAFPVRTSVDETRLRELAASIKAVGLIQPIGVEQLSDGGYRLVFGSRRLMAVKLLGEKEIRAIVLKIEDLPAVPIIENLHRDDLTMLDMAAALTRLANELGWSQDKIAEVIGKNKSYVSRMMKLRRLKEEHGNTVSFTKLPDTVYWELLETPELLIMAEDGRWTQMRARKEAMRILERRSARELGPLGNVSFNGAAGSEPDCKSTRNRAANASSPIELFRGGFRIRPFTFKASSSQDLEAVIERMSELYQKLESAISLLRQLQSAGKDDKRSSQLDFRKTFLELPVE